MSVPEEIRATAVERLREKFHERIQQAGQTCAGFCFFQIMLGPGDPAIRALFDEKWRNYYEQLDADESEEIRRLRSVETRPAIVSATFKAFCFGFKREVQTTFKQMLEIGVAKTGSLGVDSLDWAKRQVLDLIKEGSSTVDRWIADACYGNPRAQNTAHRLLLMWPAGEQRHEPGPQEWDDCTPQEFRSLYDSYRKKLVQEGESALHELCGDVHVQLAKVSDEALVAAKLAVPQLSSAPPAQSSAEWSDLYHAFKELAEEETKLLKGDNWLRVNADPGEGVRPWHLHLSSGPSADLRARFVSFASRAALLLGDVPEEVKPLDFWLESLFLDLLQQRNEGHKPRNPLGAEKPGDGAIIDGVCKESATFCARLEARTYDNSGIAAIKLPVPSKLHESQPKDHHEETLRWAAHPFNIVRSLDGKADPERGKEREAIRELALPAIERERGRERAAKGMARIPVERMIPEMPKPLVQKRAPSSLSVRRDQAKAALKKLWKSNPSASHKEMLDHANLHGVVLPWQDCSSWSEAFAKRERAVKVLLSQSKPK